MDMLMIEGPTYDQRENADEKVAHVERIVDAIGVATRAMIRRNRVPGTESPSIRYSSMTRQQAINMVTKKLESMPSRVCHRRNNGSSNNNNNNNNTTNAKPIARPNRTKTTTSVSFTDGNPAPPTTNQNQQQQQQRRHDATSVHPRLSPQETMARAVGLPGCHFQKEPFSRPSSKRKYCPQRIMLLKECTRRMNARGMKLNRANRWQFPNSKWSIQQIVGWLDANPIHDPEEIAMLCNRVKQFKSEILQQSSGGTTTKFASVSDCEAPQQEEQQIN
mmetsp:Transcript_23733/g.40259  ORF Transcript_23733/g.40259 Transcript_23733/m.40259 type:complete len:276 (-) Transcript_23733:213-1040(-)